MPATAPIWTWFTREILPDGEQTCDLFHGDARDAAIQLDLDQSRLLLTVLHEIAQDHALPFSIVRQAVLRGFAAAAARSAAPRTAELVVVGEHK